MFQGDENAVEFVDLAAVDSDGYISLVADEIDVLASATHNLQNDVREPASGMGFSFSQPYFYGFSQDEDNLCLAVHQDDKDWSSFVYWIVAGTFFAEEQNITQQLSNSMPEVFLYGPHFNRMYRDSILAVGSYGEIYERNLEDKIPRGGRNQLNVSPNLGPQHYPQPGFLAR